MRSFRIGLACLVGPLAGLSAQAATALSPAAGFFRLSAAPGSDTSLAIPLHLRSSGGGRVVSATATSLSLDIPGLVEGQYLPSATGTYYAQFVSGNLEGATYSILSHEAGVFHLETKGDDLTSHPLGAIVVGSSADVVRIRKYWTVSQIFGETPAALNSVLSVSGGVYLEGDALLLPDTTSIGVEKRAGSLIAHLANAGWRRAGDAQNDAGTTVLPPGESFIVRRTSPLPAEILVLGYVHQGRFITSFPELPNTAEHDVAVSLVQPEAVALVNSGLFGEGVRSSVLPSASLLAPGDLLLDYADTRSGFGRPPARRFFVFNGNWIERESLAGNELLKPGVGYVLRFRGTHARRYWIQNFTY